MVARLVTLWVRQGAAEAADKSHTTASYVLRALFHDEPY